MIACAVLAAGASRRLGAPKQLLEWRGRPLVAHAVEAARVVGPVAVVVGAAREAVERALERDARERVVEDEPVGARTCLLPNDAWAEGVASSVRVAAAWARSLGANALVLHLVDQPHLEGAHLARLAAEHRAGAPLVGTSYAGVIGAPALFARAFYDRLEALTGDRGGAAILRAHAETRAVPAPEGALDVDTPADAYLLAASSPKATRR